MYASAALTNCTATEFWQARRPHSWISVLCITLLAKMAFDLTARTDF